MQSCAFIVDLAKNHNNLQPVYCVCSTRIAYIDTEFMPTQQYYYFHRRSRKKKYEPAAKNSGLSTVYTTHSDASDGGVATISKDQGQCC